MNRIAKRGFDEKRTARMTWLSKECQDFFDETSSLIKARITSWRSDPTKKLQKEPVRDFFPEDGNDLFDAFMEMLKACRLWVDISEEHELKLRYHIQTWVVLKAKLALRPSAPAPETRPPKKRPRAQAASAKAPVLRRGKSLEEMIDNAVSNAFERHAAASTAADDVHPALVQKIKNVKNTPPRGQGRLGSAAQSLTMSFSEAYPGEGSDVSRSISGSSGNSSEPTNSARQADPADPARQPDPSLCSTLSSTSTQHGTKHELNLWAQHRHLSKNPRLAVYLAILVIERACPTLPTCAPPFITQAQVLAQLSKGPWHPNSNPKARQKLVCKPSSEGVPKALYLALVLTHEFVAMLDMSFGQCLDLLSNLALVLGGPLSRMKTAAEWYSKRNSEHGSQMRVNKATTAFTDVLEGLTAVKIGLCSDLPDDPFREGHPELEAGASKSLLRATATGFDRSDRMYSLTIKSRQYLNAVTRAGEEMKDVDWNPRQSTTTGSCSVQHLGSEGREPFSFKAYDLCGPELFHQYAHSGFVSIARTNIIATGGTKEEIERTIRNEVTVKLHRELFAPLCFGNHPFFGSRAVPEATEPVGTRWVDHHRNMGADEFISVVGYMQAHPDVTLRQAIGRISAVFEDVCRESTKVVLPRRYDYDYLLWSLHRCRPPPLERALSECRASAIMKNPYTDWHNRKYENYLQVIEGICTPKPKPKPKSKQRKRCNKCGTVATHNQAQHCPSCFASNSLEWCNAEDTTISGDDEDLLDSSCSSTNSSKRKRQPSRKAQEARIQCGI